MNPNYMPGFRRDFGFWKQLYHMPMMGYDTFGFSIFTLFRFLWNIAIFAVIVWFVYWLFTQSGWRISRQPGNEQQPPVSKTNV